jgi:serine/threonine protein phosphatase PrpC
MIEYVGLHWFSQKGLSRKQNSDACSVFSSKSHVLALIGDASEHGLRGAEYIEQWMRYVVDEVANADAPTCQFVLAKMRQGQAALRQRFPAERACYGALFIDHHIKAAWTFACGDCRVGLQIENDAFKWITPVHSRANWRGDEFTAEHAILESRHSVTRTLNSKRFQLPEIVKVEYNPSATWILATDGYWIEQQIQKIPIPELEDDASFLKISADANGWLDYSDRKNWYHIASGLTVPCRMLIPQQ